MAPADGGTAMPPGGGAQEGTGGCACDVSSSAPTPVAGLLVLAGLASMFMRTTRRSVRRVSTRAQRGRR
jgi:hypothetical protein